MTPALRAILAVQLGICLFSDASFGDAHHEAWRILADKEMGLRTRCISSIEKWMPFSSYPSWVAIINFIAQTHFVPSYMSWSDLFVTEKMGKSEGHEHSCNVYSLEVDRFEVEVLEKLSKQQRSKMNKYQISFITVL